MDEVFKALADATRRQLLDRLQSAGVPRENVTLICANALHRKYRASELKDLLGRKQDEIRERNRQIADGVFAAMRDPKKPAPMPKTEAVPPAINFAPLDNATAALAESARRFDKALTSARTKVVADAAALVKLNAKLRTAEIQLLDDSGLPRRGWYRHLIYAPGYYTGYGVKTIPGVREGIEDGRYEQAEREVVRAAAALTRLTSLVDSASSDLESLR